MSTNVMTAKEQVQQLLKKLPDDSSMDDIEYRLYVMNKVTRSLAAADAGELVTQDEMEQRLKQWLSK